MAANRSQAGFTILEVLVAVSILAVGLLAVASMQGSAMNANNTAGAITGAVALATDRVEKLAALPLDSVQLQDLDGDGLGGLSDTGFDNNPATTPDADSAELNIASGLHSYDIYWNVAENEPKQGNRKIQVIVTWNWKGKVKSFSMTSIR